MQVLSRCPLQVASSLWMPQAGTYAFLVVCKATFRIAEGVSMLADEQDAVLDADVAPDDDSEMGIVAASDLVPFKRQPEVLLVGHAYAPGGAPTARVVARLAVAEVDKTIEVTGDRHFALEGSLSSPKLFTKMPLVWERAAGGADTSNPIGVPMGPEARADGWGRVTVPNLLPLGTMVSDRSDVVAPICFSPVAPGWPSRLARMPHPTAGFRLEAWHARPLPPGLDPGVFNAAPRDQQLRELWGTERITLENLHPSHAELTTRLASVRPRAQVDLGGGSGFELPLACDTLLIDTDRAVACLTFRGSMSLDVPERSGWVVVTMEGDAAQAPSSPSPISPPEVRAPASSSPAAVRSSSPEPPPAVEAPPIVPQGPRLGAFRLASSTAESPARKPPPSEPPVPVAASDLDEAPTMAPDEAEAALEPLFTAQSAARRAPSLVKGAFLPGTPAPPIPGAPLPPVRAPLASMGRAETALPPHVSEPVSPLARSTGADLVGKTGLPFAQVAPAAEASGRAPQATGLPFAVAGAVSASEAKAPRAAPGGLPFVAAETPSTASVGVSGAAPTGLPFAAVAAPQVVEPQPAQSPPRTIGELAADGRGIALSSATARVAEPTTSIESDPTADAVPEPPPRLGPHATPEMVAADVGAPSHEEIAAEEPVPAAEDRGEPSTTEDAGFSGPPALPVEAYPIERCARIAASIARTPEDAASIFEAHDKLDAELWERLRTHWANEIKTETSQGTTRLLRAYDAAYVAQLEEERGPISIEEYARINVAFESGTTAETLAEMGLPAVSMPYIQRVWIGKMSKDSELGRLVRGAVEATSARGYGSS